MGRERAWRRKRREARERRKVDPAELAFASKVLLAELNGQLPTGAAHMLLGVRAMPELQPVAGND